MKATKLVKHKESLSTAPRADTAFGLPALAWTDDTDAQGVAVVHYVSPGRRRFAHEAAHALRDQDNAALHHPWWHFCVLVGHSVRLWDAHATTTELRAGQRLLAAAADTPTPAD